MNGPSPSEARAAEPYSAAALSGWLLKWTFPKTPIYWLDISGDLTADMVRALFALRRQIRAMVTYETEHTDEE